MAEESGAKQYGLRLTLGGASSEPYTVPGYIGHFWAEKATPVGGPGEVKLERAREADKDDNVPLKLEPMSKAEADKRRTEIEDWRAVARSELRTIQPDTVDDADRKAAEVRDTAPVKES